MFNGKFTAHRVGFGLLKDMGSSKGFYAAVSGVYIPIHHVITIRITAQDHTCLASVYVDLILHCHRAYSYAVISRQIEYALIEFAAEAIQACFGVFFNKGVLFSLLLLFKLGFACLVKLDIRGKPFLVIVTAPSFRDDSEYGFCIFLYASVFAGIQDHPLFPGNQG